MRACVCVFRVRVFVGEYSVWLPLGLGIGSNRKGNVDVFVGKDSCLEGWVSAGPADGGLEGSCCRVLPVSCWDRMGRWIDSLNDRPLLLWGETAEEAV